MNIKVGIIGNKNLVSYKRRLALLLQAKHSKIEYSEAIVDDKYDIIITELRDIKLIFNKFKFKHIIFELPDNILELPIQWYKKKYKTFYLLYSYIAKKKIKSHLQLCDFIITGSKLQEESYLKVNQNVKYITDPITKDLCVFKKPIIYKKNCLHLGLESGGLNVHSILNNKQFIRAILEMDNIVLHIVIDDIVLPKQYCFQNVHHELYKVFGKKIKLYDWNRENFVKLLQTIDIAVIPVDMQEKFAVSKPSNRPSIMMANFKPVICSPIPSYLNDLSNFDTCRFALTKSEWIDSINFFASMNNSLLKQKLIKNQQKVLDKFSKTNFIKFHNSIVESFFND